MKKTDKRAPLPASVPRPVKRANGPRGGVDHVCNVKAVLSGLPSVVVQRRDASPHTAIDLALRATEQAVRRSVSRRRMKPLRRLGEAGFTPDYIDATAHVTIERQDGGFKITKSHIVCKAMAKNLEQAAFVKHAEAAKANCPVSQALARTNITLEATLAGE